MQKEYILKKYFKNEIEPRSLRGFKQKTPEGNTVSGWINLEPGRYLSSMVLTEIKTPDKTIKCERFIRGMPKQHYYDENEWDLYRNEDESFIIHPCYEKIDGTCIILYALYDDEDNLIEIVPRTRGMPVAQKRIIKMFNLIDKAQIEDFYYYPHNYDYVLMFEMFGILNRHEISYYQNYIDIKLIGATFQDKVRDRKEYLKIAYEYHFNIPSLFFEIVYYSKTWKIYPSKSKLFPYYINKDIFENKYASLSECINSLVNIMEDINNNYKEKNNHIAIEGVVINGYSENKEQRYVKIKPTSIFEKAKLGGGIPSHAIRKEMYKYFDEYGVIDIKKIYKKDPFHYADFIKRNLKEEFPSEYVDDKRTEKKISNIFFKSLRKLSPNKDVQTIGEILITQYPDEEITELMRIFAKEYPEFKKKSRELYNYLKLLKEEK